MSYRLKPAESAVLGKDKYVNAKGHTECVEFIRQAAGAPVTTSWRPGVKVSDANPGAILRGTAIATFDSNGRYPTDLLGKHAAIYLSQTKDAIQVLDQWDSQHEVKPRNISLKKPAGTKRSDDGKTFYVIE
jgi:hypothetical protein